ncbi:MAG: hypothetical protein IIV13_06940 [Bacteroidaceae bacterium]|nr:hypothetical protein [Bacteroidaceae bacterium]
MKKLLVLIPVAIMALFTSCDNTVLTASSAKDAIKKDAFWDNPIETKSFKVGYYAVDESEITTLQQLQTAGMITLSVDKAVEARKRWRNVEYITHYFAKVDLTEKGQKYVCTEEPKHGRKDLLEELEDNDKEEKLPKYMTQYNSVAINTLLPDPSVGNTTESDSDDSYSSSSSNSYSSRSYSSSSSSTPAEPSAYEKALKKVNSEFVTVIVGEWELVAAKEVYCPEEYVKVGKGECKIIMEFTEKTPFGYALGVEKEGYKVVDKAKFKRYEDLGWVLAD